MLHGKPSKCADDELSLFCRDQNPCLVPADLTRHQASLLKQHFVLGTFLCQWVWREAISEEKSLVQDFADMHNQYEVCTGRFKDTESLCSYLDVRTIP